MTHRNSDIYEFSCYTKHSEGPSTSAHATSLNTISKVSKNPHATSLNTIAKVSKNPPTGLEAMNYYSGCELGMFCKAFEIFDEDGDGKLSVDEICEFVAKLGLTMTEKELATMMMAIDKNNNGFVDLEEFLSLYRILNCDEGRLGCIEEADDENLKQAFRVFDKNKDGYISAEELHIVLANVGLAQGNNLIDCRNMIRGVDLDGDGQINFMEFKAMMSPKCSRCSSATVKQPKPRSTVKQLG